MKRNTFATISAGALAALSIALAAPGAAAPSGPNDDTFGPVPTISAPAPGWTNPGQTPYGTYQNNHPRGSASKR